MIQIRVFKTAVAKKKTKKKVTIDLHTNDQDFSR